MAMRNDDTSAGTAAGLPRWVKWFLIVTAAIVGVGLLLMVLLGGEHGPGRHTGLGPVAAAPIGYAAAPGGTR
jgi:hypothetical protein